jgi:hypothetical protein
MRNANRKHRTPMTLLLILVAWIVLLWFIAGLCRAARLGDLQPGRAQAANGAGVPERAVLARASITASRRAAARPSGSGLQAGGVRV